MAKVLTVLRKAVPLRREVRKVPAKRKPSSKKVKGADGKACWKGYSYAGTKNGKDKCVKTKK
jgi:hypothetical protein